MKYISNKAIAIFLVLVIVALSTNAQDKKYVDGIVAKVDNYVVLDSDVSLALKDARSRGQYDQTRCQVLEGLVINKLLLAKAEIDSVVVSDAEVDLQVENRMSMMINQIGSEEKIEEYYGKTVEEFKVEVRDDIKEQMIISRMQQEITADVEVTPTEVKTFFKNIPRDSLPYYSTQVRVGQIVKKPDMSREAKNNIVTRLNALRDRILEGEDFAKIARLYSEEPGAKRSGGTIGFFKRGQLAPEYEATALKLKPGEISKPVETDFGFHVIQLLERRGNEFNTRHILIRPRYTNKDMQRAKNYLDSIRTMIVNDSISFEKAAKEFSDDPATASSGGYFTDQQYGGSLIVVDQLETSVFFTIDSMDVGSITKPITYNMQDGSEAVRLIYYKDRVKPHQANLDLDYQRIKNAALNRKNSQVLSEWFEEAKGDVYITIDDKYSDCSVLN